MRVATRARWTFSSWLDGQQPVLVEFAQVRQTHRCQTLSSCARRESTCLEGQEQRGERPEIRSPETTQATGATGFAFRVLDAA